MERFLGGAFARFVLVPLFGVFLANYARVLSRRRRETGDENERRRLRPEDLAVGLDMTVLALVSLLGLVVERVHSVLTAQQSLQNLLDKGTNLSSVQKLQASQAEQVSQNATSDFLTYVVTAALFAILLFTLSALTEGAGRNNEGELRVGYGIIVPAVLGALSLLVVWVLAISGGAT